MHPLADALGIMTAMVEETHSYSVSTLLHVAQSAETVVVV